ncbi:MAG: hypothetical protein GY804_09695 [Alphaproteobacteria bacterium]|nr:hypothetical protein [Alphaproteobacteria bacterium]
MKLFNSKCIVEVFGLSEGFCWEAHFDINTGLYIVVNRKYFDSPVECIKGFEEFAKENEIEKYEIDWEKLK